MATVSPPPYGGLVSPRLVPGKPAGLPNADHYSHADSANKNYQEKEDSEKGWKRKEERRGEEKKGARKEGRGEERKVKRAKSGGGEQGVRRGKERN